jgi:hypothetical protein
VSSSSSKKPTQKSKSAKKVSEKRKRFLLLPSTIALTISLFAALIATLVGLWQLTDGGGPWGNQLQMTWYLQNKYGQDFVVKNVHLQGSGLGVRGDWTADVYPKNNPSIKSQLSRVQGTSQYEHDTFLDVLWTHQAQKEVDQFIKQLGYVKDYTLTISASSDFINSVHGSTPSFDEVRRTPSTFGYDLSVQSTLPASEREPSNAQLTQALRLVQYVKQMNSISPEVHYLYKDDNFNAVNRFGQILYEYSINVDRYSIGNINNPADLAKYFKLIK